jgi:hypothetical protein
MATIEDLFAALKAADKAGDVENATKLARYISNLGYGPQIEPEKAPPKVGFGDYVKDIPKAIGRGAVGLLETAGVGASALLPEEYEQKARAGIGSITTPAQQYLAPSSQEVGESVSSTLASGIGSTAPFFALGPLGLLGRAGAGALGVAAGAGEARQEAEKAGATAEERSKATMLGAPTGLLDLIAPNIGPLKSIFTTALARGGVEGLTEAAQKTAQNLIAKGVYDPSKDVLAGTAEEGAYGAGVGALTSLLIDVALGRRAKGGGPKPEATPEAPAKAPAEAAPEAPPAPSLETLPPGAATPDEQAEAYRMLSQMEQDRQARAQQALADQEEMVAQAQRDRLERAPEVARGMPGFTGMPDENAAMMGAIRQRQEEERLRQEQERAAEEERQVAEQLTAEKERQAEIRRIQQTTFSADPVQNQIVKQRLLDQLAEKEAAKVVTVTSPTEEPAGLFPKGEPIIKEPQRKPTQAKKYTPEEQEEANSIRETLADVNKQLKEAKAEKGNLFNILKGRLIERPGAFSLNDIAPDDKSLRGLVNKEDKGDLLEDLVADGALDDYLPFRNRKNINGAENPNFDDQAALQHIADKLANKDYSSESAKDNIRILEEQRDAYKTQLERFQGLPEVKLELDKLQRQQKAEQVEPVGLQDLIDDARYSGVDVDALEQNVKQQMPDATPEQYQGALRYALNAATSKSPSYEIGGIDYSKEEIESLIGERFTEDEINELIAQAEAQQASVTRTPKVPEPRAEAVPPVERATETEPGEAEIKVPKAASRAELGMAVEDNDWNRITDQLSSSKNPIISNLGTMAKDLVGVTTEINPSLLRRIAPQAAAGWSKETNGIYFRNKKYAANEHVVAHETAHALTYFAVNNPTAAQKPAVRRLDNLYRYVKTKLGKRGRDMYGLTDLDEFIAEANSNAEFQKELAKIPYQKQTAWGAFTQAVADLLGIKNSNALTEILALTEELASTESRTSVEAKPAAQKPGQPPALTAPPGFKAKKGRNEQVVLAARELAAGRITKQQYDEYVDYYAPIEPVLGDKLEAPIEGSLMRDILTTKIKQKKNAALVDAPINDGTRVGLRMDIPALEWGRLNGVNGSVVSVHRGTSPDTKTTGPNISYKSTGHITNAVFAPRSEEKSFGIAQGLEGTAGEKTPQQTIEGNWVNTSPEETFKRIKSLLNDPSWKQISLDPLRHSFFYDRKNRQPVVSADEVLQVGRFVLAKNPVYAKREDFLYVKQPWGERESPDAYGREKTLTLMYNRMRDAYDEGYDIDEAYELAYENATKAEKYILRQLKKDDFLGFDYPHQAIRAIIEDPDAYEMSTGLKVAISRLGNNYIVPLKAAAVERTQTGEDAMEILSGMGRFVKEPEPGYVAKARQAWDNAVDNPKLAKEQSMGAFRRWADQFETWAFSSDAALNNQIRREVMDSMKGQEEKVGILLNASLSQTVHSDAVANLFLMKGNVKYDNELHKWVGVDDKSNIFNLSKQLDEIAQKHGLTKEEIELIAHTAFEAKRTQSLIRENEAIEARVAAMRAEARRIRGNSPVAASELSDKASKLLQKRKVIHMTEEDIAAGMSQFELFPELAQVVETWNGIRENALDVMVETGLYSRDEAENLMANADYVPFFREEQIEEGKGPKEFLRSLSVQADKRMKGSKKPVNDIFDNMVRWTQYAVNRGVRNRSALALVDTAGELKLGEKVTGPKDGENVVRVWRNGEQEYHSMADPMFVTAFRGLESVAIPTVKFFSKFADTLRQSVVLFPLFSVSQVTQDSFAAMFSSGLKPQHALSIPFRAVKEFIQTLRGKSSTHEELKNVGAVGVRDFTSAIIRSDVEVLAGLKKDKSLWDTVKRALGNVAMAADNAVRQATYEAALAQGMSRAEAIEKAFEIFNVRRRGSSQMLAMAGQVIPFFNAYLAAQNVAYRTLTGVGVSPTDRKAALQTLAATTGSVMALSMLYAMMMGDDEDYEKKPTPTRDRLLMIPGSGGLGIPLRADAFVLPKVLAEHTYHLITENGMTDGAKFRASLASLLANSVLSPTVVPQAVKPITEAVLNYDFFQQKPLVGIYQAKKDLSRQFEDSTSEFSKVLGKTELISPIVADHVIRGMFGSFGGLFLQVTNPLIAEMAGVTRPSMTLRDAANAIPNASAFISKEYEVGLRKDFYALKEVTDRAAATLSDMKARSPHEIEAYLSDPEVRQRVAMAPVVNRISNQLTDIRKKVNLITNVETKEMTDDRKEELIKQLREQEYQLLKNINLRKLREMAQM